MKYIFSRSYAALIIVLMSASGYAHQGHYSPTGSAHSHVSLETYLLVALIIMIALRIIRK